MQNQAAPFQSILIPNSYKNIEQQFEEDYKYRLLAEISKTHSKIEDRTLEQMGEGKHRAVFPSLDEAGLKRFRELESRNPELQFNNEVMSMLKEIITDDLDRELKAYLGSNYAIMFYDKRTLTTKSGETNPSTKWHCDAAPKHSAMVICYLDSDEDSGSSTLFMGEETTIKLKEAGYVYCDISNRMANLDSVTDFYGLDNQVYRHGFRAGETAVFGAANILHRAEVPKQHASRTTLDIAVIASPVPWYEAIEKGYTPFNSCIHYKGQVQRLLSCVNLTKQEDAVSDDLTTHASRTNEPLSVVKHKEVNGGESSDIIEDKDVVQISFSGGINTPESLLFHLKSIFTNTIYAENLHSQLMGRGINFETLTISELVSFLKTSFQQGLKWNEPFNNSDLENLSDLVAYEKKHAESIGRFTLAGKPNPEAVMWPIPDHPKHPRCKFDMTPYVTSEKIMDQSTPIGSAGSCFAVEIAEVLQDEKFNYVVTELGDNPKEEAIIDGYEVGSGKAMYSANFGILFNTPSLRQIAEKAFGEREFNKYLVQADNGLYMDPYRENVFFLNRENYLRDYPKHVQAIKDVLLQSEVFIFTAGLNECWQLFDGSVISRNPRNGFYHLIEHKVLTVEENINNIMTFFNIVKRHNPKFKLVLTLSPVPLLATGRGQTHHILEANTHSKAVLRVALEEVVKMHPDIHYLPSYEMVTECVENPWKPDHRHVTPETVSRVVSMFKEMFVR